MMPRAAPDTAARDFWLTLAIASRLPTGTPRDAVLARVLAAAEALDRALIAAALDTETAPGELEHHALADVATIVERHTREPMPVDDGEASS